MWNWPLNPNGAQTLEINQTRDFFHFPFRSFHSTAFSVYRFLRFSKSWLTFFGDKARTQDLDNRMTYSYIYTELSLKRFPSLAFIGSKECTALLSKWSFPIKVSLVTDSLTFKNSLTENFSFSAVLHQNNREMNLFV